MKLGKLQKYWIEQLRKHSERQATDSLGSKNGEAKYQLCCLGQLVVCNYQLKKKRIPFDEDGCLRENIDGNPGLLSNTYEKYGLFSKRGGFKDNERVEIKEGLWFEDLVNANDYGITWPELADFIEKNPEKVFSKSV